MKLFKDKPVEVRVNEDRSFQDLIDEQRQKESINVWRRGYAVGLAIDALDETYDASELLRMARQIYMFVYGEECPE